MKLFTSLITIELLTGPDYSFFKLHSPQYNQPPSLHSHQRQSEAYNVRLAGGGNR